MKKNVNLLRSLAGQYTILPLLLLSPWGKHQRHINPFDVDIESSDYTGRLLVSWLSRPIANNNNHTDTDTHTHTHTHTHAHTHTHTHTDRHTHTHTHTTHTCTLTHHTHTHIHTFIHFKSHSFIKDSFKQSSHVNAEVG